MKKKKILMAVLAVALVIGLYGCASSIDPITGEKTYSVSEPAAKIGDTAAAAAEGAAPLLGVFGPIGTLIGGVLITMAGAWKKWRAPLIQKEALLDRIVKGATVTSDVLESFKRDNPELWDKLKRQLKSAESAGAINSDKVRTAVNGS